MYYKNKAHEIIFKTYIVKCPYKLPPRTLAAIYLLSADRDTWRRAKKCIEKKEVKFDNISLYDCSVYGYTLIKTALDIYDMNEMHINLFDLSDKYLISNKTFDLTVQAMRIARNGYEETDINKKFN